MGHATRIVPLIKKLQQENEIILGISPSHEFFFEAIFPHLKKIELPSYQISYSRFLPVWLKLILQAPRIFSVIRKENALLKKIISTHSVNLVISDNRYGLYNNKVESIFITHQLIILSPVFSSWANWMNIKLLRRFQEVWVPDYEPRSERLSGNLSENKKVPIPVRFIGPQSRFVSGEVMRSKSIDLLILLSGIEPQRSLLENMLLEKFKESKLNIVLVRGKEKVAATHKNIRIIDFADTNLLGDLIVNARTVICRSGYSTLMDLHILGFRNLILVPTPGQTEQEYLARYWQQNYKAKVIHQRDLTAADLQLGG